MTRTELVEIGVAQPDVGYPRAAEAAANALRLDPSWARRTSQPDSSSACASSIGPGRNNHSGGRCS
jgi:hypothetical protein